MGNIQLRLSLKGEDKQQMDAITGNFIQVLQGTDAEFLRASETHLEIQALIRNLPVQMSLEDAEQLRALLRDMLPVASGPATMALEILETAILIR